MLSIPAATYPCWPGFDLLLETDLVFTGKRVIYLSGSNGSGKSSFITKVLLPKVKVTATPCYTIYLEQLFHLQAYSIKAEAALKHPEKRLLSNADCLAYLLNDLELAQKKQLRPVLAFADESHFLLDLYHFLEASGFDYSLIYSIHGEDPLPTPHKTLSFIPETQRLSIIRCN